MAGNKFGTGIPLITGFDLAVQEALDHRVVKSTIEERDAMPDIQLYEGLVVYVENNNTNYQLISLSPKKWEIFGTSGGVNNPVNPDNFTKVVPINKGGTGANTAKKARENLEVPPKNHASESSEYGAASDNQYGHVILSTDNPLMNGDSAPGKSTYVSKADHVHPHDTTRVSIDDFNKYKTEQAQVDKTQDDNLSKHISDFDKFKTENQSELDQLNKDNELAHQKITNSVDLLKKDLINNVTELTQKINSESSDRSTSDENLQEQINNLTQQSIGNAVFNSDVPLYVTIGGFELGETFVNVPSSTMWRKLLYPYKQPTITFNITPSPAVYELGTTISSVTLKAVISKMSDDISIVQFLKNSANLGNAITNKPNGGTITYQDTNIKSTVTYNVKVTDGKSKSYTGTNRTYTFVYPMYAGVLDTDQFTESNIKGLTKKVMSPSNYKHQPGAFTNKRMVMACPPRWTISKMIDSNGFDNTASFKNKKLSITCLDGTQQQYTIYYNDPSTQDANFYMNFNR